MAVMKAASLAIQTVAELVDAMAVMRAVSMVDGSVALRAG